MSGRRRWCVGTFVLLAALVLAPSPSAQAHASLVGSTPTNGASLQQAPSQIRLWFDEPLRSGFGSFDLVDADGGTIPVRRLASVPDARSVVLTLPPIPDGIYSVRWSVVSTIDSHVTEGTVVFGVGDDALAVATAAVGTPDAPIHGWEVFLRWLDLTTLALAIGGLVVGRWVVPTHRPAGWASATIRRRALGVAGWAAAAAVAVGIGLLAWQVVSIGTSDAGEGSAGSVAGQVLFHGRWATLWTARQLSLLALVALVFSIRRGRTARWPEAFVMVAVVVVTRALGSHAASVSDPFASVVVDAVHMAAAGVWIGGAIALFLATRGIGSVSSGAQVTVQRSWRRFGRVAAASVGILVVTGLLEAARQVVSLDALLGSAYGKGLLAKAGLVGLVMLLGLMNAFAFHPRLRARFRRGSNAAISPRVRPRARRAIIATEVVLGTLVLLAVGFIGSAAPARGPRYAVDAGQPPSSMAQEVDDLLVTLRVTPNLVGSNLVVVDVISTRRPSPAPVRGVSLTISGSGAAITTVKLRAAGDDRYQAPSDRLSPSATPLSVIVERPGLPDAEASFSWRVGTGSPARVPVASTRPIGSLLVGAAAALGVLLLATALVWTRPRQGRGRDEPALARGWMVVVPDGSPATPPRRDDLPDPGVPASTGGRTRWPHD